MERYFRLALFGYSLSVMVIGLFALRLFTQRLLGVYGSAELLGMHITVMALHERMWPT